MADWSSLPGELVLHIAKFLLADDDIDYYMDFRAVCKSWHNSTDDPKADGRDPRFQPKVWAVLKNYGYLSGSCVVSMVNLRTCRVLQKKIPKFRDYYFFNATDGGLLVLGEKELPSCQACVLNPFTGHKFYFMAPICAEEVKAVAMTTSPVMRLFVSNLWDFVGWAEQNSQEFEEYRIQFQISDYYRPASSMIQVGGAVHVVHRDGSIVSTTTEEGHSAREMTSMSTTIHDGTSWPDFEGHSYSDNYYYGLVESAGELLLVSRRIDREGHVAVLLHKVDTVRKVLEPVESIGKRAIFTSKARSFIVDAFPTIKADCIYFVDTTKGSLFKDAIVATSFCLADQKQKTIKMGLGSGPPTLVQVLADHCRFIPTHEYDFFHREDEELINGFSSTARMKAYREKQFIHGRFCAAFSSPFEDVFPLY